MTSPRQDEKTYKKTINSWALYHWAENGYATTIVSTIHPVYYSHVAASTLGSNTATTSWANYLQRRLTFSESFKSINGVNSFAVLSLRDPVPFIYDMFDQFMYKFRRLPFIRRIY